VGCVVIFVGVVVSSVIGVVGSGGGCDDIGGVGGGYGVGIVDVVIIGWFVVAVDVVAIGYVWCWLTMWLVMLLLLCVYIVVFASADIVGDVGVTDATGGVDSVCMGWVVEYGCRGVYVMLVGC